MIPCEDLHLSLDDQANSTNTLSLFKLILPFATALLSNNKSNIQPNRQPNRQEMKDPGKKTVDHLLNIPEMDIRGKTKDYPSINDYYRAASRGDIPIQYQHGLSNYSNVQLGDERVSFKKSLSQDAFRLDIYENENLKSGEDDEQGMNASTMLLKQRKENYAEANEVVGLNKIHEMEQMMRDKLQQRTKTGPFQLRKTFKYFDRDGSGGIDFSEFQLAMELMGFQFTEMQQLALFARYDESCTGEVDYNNFVEKVMESDFKVVKKTSNVKKNLSNLVSSAFAQSNNTNWATPVMEEDEDDSDLEEDEVEKIRRREVKKLFDIVDKDGSGYIDKLEMCELLKSLGKEFDRENVNEGFYAIDKDNSGLIEFSEFYEWFKKVHCGQKS
jgi:Ca2+-binding protein (EF-Hand superfamily)